MLGATTIRPSVERVSRSGATWSYLEYSCLVVFKDIVPTSSAGNSSNRIRKFSMCCFKCRYGFIATMSHQAPASRTFRCSNAYIGIGLFLHHLFICLTSVVEFLYQPVYNGCFPLLSQLLPALQEHKPPHKSSAEV